MNKETKKIAWACFIGGVLFGVTAFCVVPMFWWLGTLAGIVGGYFGYEFRKALRAIPKAWRTAKTETSELFRRIQIAGHLLGEFFRQPHPFGYLSLFIGVGMFYWALGSEFIIIAGHVGPIARLMITALGFCLFCLFFFAIISLIAMVGDIRYPITYGRAIYSLIRGAGRIAFCLIWTLWKRMFIGIARAFVFAGRFLGHLFIFIHSSECVLCAIDGTLGGMAAFLWLAPSAETLTAKAAVVVFGGLLGTGWGALNYEIVSMRWLHLVPRH